MMQSKAEVRRMAMTSPEKMADKYFKLKDRLEAAERVCRIAKGVCKTECKKESVDISYWELDAAIGMWEEAREKNP